MVIRFHKSFLWLILAISLIICNISLTVSVAETYSAAIAPGVLIIDAGHGGADGGAVGVNGVIESNVNLQIALKLESLCHLFGVSTAMTRNTDEIIYPDEADTIAKKKSADQSARLQLIQEIPQGILFSIHQNNFPTASPHGVEVLYGHSESSRAVGELLQQNLTAALCPDNRRVAAEIRDEIYLLRECECTAVLIECGFLSNPAEAMLLQTEEYQIKIAAVLLASYLQYTS